MYNFTFLTAQNGHENISMFERFSITFFECYNSRLPAVLVTAQSLTTIAVPPGCNIPKTYCALAVAPYLPSWDSSELNQIDFSQFLDCRGMAPDAQWQRVMWGISPCC